jgi:hypothetical protein
MGNINKSATTYIIQPFPPPQPSPPPLPSHPPQPCAVPLDWETHPSWIAGMAALNAYNNWVSEIVMPIAFQWIEEHKAEVYANIPEHLKDDVGVVIAAAFELIKRLGAYQKGLVKFEEYERALQDGTWDPASINPVWASISRDIRGATDESFDIHRDVLKDTIR